MSTQQWLAPCNNQFANSGGKVTLALVQRLHDPAFSDDTIFAGRDDRL
jgi:hypothetical protein